MYAIVRSGGKQFKVAPGDVVRIEKPSVKASKGETLSLTDVVFAGAEDGKTFKDAKAVVVKATVLSEVRSRKVLVFKKKKRKQYRRTKGHRQTLVEIRIDAIEG
jgi:large subunit ribosomal protein L21